MIKKLPVILCICLLITSASFFGLWQAETRDRSDIRDLAVAGASSSLDSFRRYRETGDETHYWNGVAEFNSFEQAYHILADGTNKESNFIFCNEVYGSLLLDPERSMAHIDDIIEVMEMIAADFNDPNGFARMASLRNSIKE